jgi:hypothetical protein
VALVIVQLGATYSAPSGGRCAGEITVTPDAWTASGHERHPPIPVTITLSNGGFSLPILAPGTSGDPACRYRIHERIEADGTVIDNEYVVTLPRANAGDAYDLGDLTDQLTWTAPSTPGTGTTTVTDTF